MAKKQNPRSGGSGSDWLARDRSASPFAALAGLRDQLPPGEPSGAGTRAESGAASGAGTRAESGAGTRAARPPVPPAAASAPPRGPARAVVRYERKGRGGKEATLIEQLGLPAADLETWCRELKRALGCGGGVERTAILLSGDQRKRLPALLDARGVRRVTVS